MRNVNESAAHGPALGRRSFLGLALLATRVRAAAFPTPDRPIRLLVGYPAGGGTDLQARLLAQQLSQAFGVPVIVDNRPGAGTMIAATELARSAPDGHSLMYTPTTTLTQLPQTMRAVRYDPVRDFTPVAQCALGPVVLLVHRSIPATNLRELIAYAKQHPGELNYVSQGIGTSAHVFGQMLSRQAGIDIVHVPYKGANDVSKDLLTGRVQLQFASSSAAVQLARTGQVRLLGVVAPRRSALFPDLPTMSELGITGMDMDSSLGVIGPAHMPSEIVSRVSEALRTALEIPHVREEFQAGGVEVDWAGPTAFAETIHGSSRAWGRLLASVGFVKQ